METESNNAKNPETFFLREKPVKILICLADKEKVWYARMLAKETDTTYAHTVKILDEMAEYGLISFQKEGRIRIVKLTDVGEELAHEFEVLVRRVRKLGKAQSHD